MLDVRAFQPADIEALGAIQPMQLAEIAAAPPDIGVMLQYGGPSWAVHIGGRVVAIGGLRFIGPRKAFGWALVAESMTDRERVGAVRIAARMVRQAKWLGIDRIEATTRVGWAPAARVMSALGFVCETPDGMRKYGPDGSAHYQWARVE